MINIGDYHSAVSFIVSEIKKFPKHLVPKIVIRSGNLKSPGISDLDFLIGFPDDFLFGNAFIEEFNLLIKNMKYKDIFFLHLPNIYPISSLLDLPKYTFNEIDNCEIILGENLFNNNTAICDEQIIIRSIEFIHSRIIDFLIKILTNNLHANKLLVEGHSFIHSYNAITKLGINLNKQLFKNFLMIEEFRDDIVQGKKVDIIEEDCKKLYEGICSEFYFLLKQFYILFQKNVAMHFEKNLNFHQYDDRVMLENLSNEDSVDLNVDIKNNVYKINGFSWELRCLFDNLFLKKDQYKTVFINESFEQEILNKRNYLKKLYQFNFLNFGNAHGRSGFTPLVTGKVFDRLAKQLIDV